MRLRRVIAPVTAVVLLFGVVASPAQAHDEAGAVAGTITSQSSGAPIDHATVDLFAGGHSPAEQTRTAADGSYRFDGLEAGTYAVCVDTTTEPEPRHAGRYGYASRCYVDADWIGFSADGGVPSSAQPVMVSVGTTTAHVDVALRYAAVLAGGVDADTRHLFRLGGVGVVVYRTPASTSGDPVATTITDVDGTWRIRDLPPEPSGYAVCFYPPVPDRGPGYLPECYDNKPCPCSPSAGFPADITTVAAESGVLSAGINAALGRAAGLAGSLEDAGGAPISGVVYVGQPGTSPTTGVPVGPNGRWSIPQLDPADGPVIVCFSDDPTAAPPADSTGHAPECNDDRPWLHARTVPDADPVPLVAGRYTRLPVAQLGAGAAIRAELIDGLGGRVTDGFVAIFASNGDLVASGDTDHAGRFSVTGLRPTGYNVCASSAGRQSACYGNIPWDGHSAPDVAGGWLVRPGQFRSFRVALYADR